MEYRDGKRRTSMLVFAFSREDTTSSITLLMFRTLSSSFRRAASRASSAVYLDSARCFEAAVAFSAGAPLASRDFVLRCAGVSTRASWSES